MAFQALTSTISPLHLNTLMVETLLIQFSIGLGATGQFIPTMSISTRLDKFFIKETIYFSMSLKILAVNIFPLSYARHLSLLLFKAVNLSVFMAFNFEQCFFEEVEIPMKNFFQLTCFSESNNRENEFNAIVRVFVVLGMVE